MTILRSTTKYSLFLFLLLMSRTRSIVHDGSIRSFCFHHHHNNNHHHYRHYNNKNKNAMTNSYSIYGRICNDATRSIPSSSTTTTITTRFSHHPHMSSDAYQQLIIATDDAITSTTSIAVIPPPPPPTTTAMTMTDHENIGMLSKEATIIIFIIGIIPFIIATYEFWRRIAMGATFGTGTDTVIFPRTITTTIGEDNAPTSSRGKQILGTDSLITAYIIFTTVAVVLGIVFYSVITSPIPTSI